MRMPSHVHGLARVGRAFTGETLPTRRLWLPIAILLAFAACRDATAPLDQPNLLGDRVRPPSYGETHALRQSPTAPPLETYQVSFWARRDEASTVTVDYLPAAHHSRSRPFLRFDIPKGAVRPGVSGLILGPRDSVLITLTIDPNDFSVEFEPSGLQFSRRHPAVLAIWYGNADPDLNGDGAVDADDETLTQQIAIWGRRERPAARWRETSSHTETGQWVTATLLHFSEYAVCW
jgi:hypothetical protein